MPWNWELSGWPKFRFNQEAIAEQERKFLLGAGGAFAFLKSVEDQERLHFIVEILSQEGLESSKIEGEILDRESLQSSIKKHFGMIATKKEKSIKESGMAETLCDVYESYDKPLTNKMLCKWHENLFKGQTDISDIGVYRAHPEPMQIVSNRLGSKKVFFEAPPSINIPKEMESFIHWFNEVDPSAGILGRAAIAHVYFESIHPFEDGNGRIGRLLIEKVLSQDIGRPVLIAISNVLEKRKKEYYLKLEKCNRTLDVQEWVEYFADVVLQGQAESINLLLFLVEKSRLLTTLSEQLNSRQEKVLLRLFAEGPSGFKGGLSAENYIAMTQTSKATATRDLNDLVEKGALVKTGELRHTRYWLNIKSM